MSEDTPEIGLVIRHVYLWRNEKQRGHEEGRKARPCLIVHKRQNEYDETEVFICPITHTKPSNPALALEIPLITKQRLKLDDEQSWIITSELNRFTWKGTDLRQTQTGEFAYGFLPHGLTKASVRQVQKNAKTKTLDIVSRDDPVLLKAIRDLKNKNRPKNPN
ncbi:MAG: growth inhibitor PemK [SAR86 cluster bacterium]|uniref:Growth inhibitor PemK n=1 Tax=SAR86 cluster bacterium TaxID=2030880 RepID=A0A2A5CCJ7_9GAMM|nr:type II toxin-antitoxin system PemK/MazF family toxin [Gammaproteobacteria bacterium AH-315-E17]PCJ41096.1 MAG: growth inhibitor PemK [SAR86 cluster bacterium]